MIATVPGNRSRMVFGTALARTKALPIAREGLLE